MISSQWPVTNEQKSVAIEAVEKVAIEALERGDRIYSIV